ncbi:hypothetical protein [Haloarchaeobius sp. TZWSO28]|uniref:hypothetical protein n=1 Tax=Haloarchaeobius sp. TZWSO28 TaxID=3446119 RepID=UPI003EBCB90E
MSDDDQPVGIDARDDDLVGTPDDPGHLARWLTLFRSAWAEGATREHTQRVPGVPHVGRAGTTAELSDILAMTATSHAHHYRRYLTGEESLANVLGLDTPGLDRRTHESDDVPSSLPDEVLDLYDDTVLNALIGGPDSEVSDVVRRTMTNFRLLEWQWDPVSGSYQRPPSDDSTETDWKREVVLETNRSEALQKQRKNLKTAVEALAESEDLPTSALDVHVANLLFQDLDPQDDVLPLVDDGVGDHVRALLTEDYDTVRKMGIQLEFDGNGRVSNEFKKEVYLELDEIIEANDFLTEEQKEDIERQADRERLEKAREMAEGGGPPGGGMGPGSGTTQPGGGFGGGQSGSGGLGGGQPGTVDPPQDGGGQGGFDGGGDPEDAERARRENQLKQVLAKFKRPHTTDDGEEIDLFTRHARLENIGDETYSLLDGQRPLANYEPGTAVYALGMSPRLLRSKALQFTYQRIGADMFYPMRQRRARFEKLEVLHELGMDDRYDDNPAMMRSVGRHLLRFSLQRARHSAALRQSFLEGEVSIEAGAETGGDVYINIQPPDSDDYSMPLNRFLDRLQYPNTFHVDDPSFEPETPFDLGSVDAADDPRLEQVGHSLRYLQAVDPDDLDRLLRGTLDLASHRFDAWWTSLATRRLAEHRNEQDNWYLPEPTTYRNDAGENVWKDSDAYIPPAGVPDWPPESFTSDEADEDDEDDGQSQDLTDTSVTETVDMPSEAETWDREFDEGTKEYVLDAGNDLVSDPSTEQVSPSVPLPESSAGIHVGAWGFVENLHPDETDAEGEFVHAPSLDQATTAAVLRGGHKAFQNQDDGHLSAVDLSADRVRIARQVLDGVREGQPLGALLGYRFERGLHEANQQQYIHDFRQAYPTFTGTLGGPEPSKESARSDVVDGYKLYRSVTFDDGTHTIDPTPPRRPDTDERPETPGYRDRQSEYGLPPLSENPGVAGALWHLFEAVDAVRDVLTAESVHQFTRGNYSRAAGSLESLAAGKAVPEPQVIDTPRTSVGLTHRLLVTFGDADGATTPSSWQDDTVFTHPAVPPADSSDDEFTHEPEMPEIVEDEARLAQPGHDIDPTDGSVIQGPDVPAVGQDDALPLQTRKGAEPNLDSWVGEMLPDPADVGCEAAYRWTEEREFAANTFRTPKSSGRVSVTDLGFEPDVLVFTASVAAEGPNNTDKQQDEPPTHHGWGHGSAKRASDGTLTQQSVSAVYDTEAGQTIGTADTDDALHLAFAGDDSVSIRGTVAETTAEGFEFDVSVTGTDRAVTVQYLALAVTDPALVEVGHFETASGSHTESLGVDADTVVLTATDAVDATPLGAQGATTRATTGGVGLSYGHATAGSNGLTQHALSLSQDPAGNAAPTATARDDRVVHLPGDWSLECTGLGTDLTLTAKTTGSTARPVTYVAMASPPDEPAPEVGVLADGGNPLDGGFRPGAVEFVAVPGVTETDMTAGTSVSLADSTAGIGHGLTTGLGRQLSIADSVTGGTVAASTEVGSVVSVPTAGASTLTVELTSVSDDGFSVEFTEGSPGDCLVLYRAWPAEPTEREFVADTSLTFDELLLSPLDVVAFSKEDDETAQTQLEQRIAFYLRRNRDQKPTTAEDGHPPIPADATVELRFREAGGAQISAADLLELVRSIRETLADGRAATADDFAHPAEQTGPGYDSATFAALSDRATAAETALADVTALVDDRLDLLDTTLDTADAKEERGAAREPPTVTEQVGQLQDAISEFRSQVPISGIEEACAQVGSATGAGDDSVLEAELERVLRALPAGPTNPKEFDESLTLEPLAGQTLTCDSGLGEATSLDVTVLGNTGADDVTTGQAAQFVETRTVQTTAEGVFSVDLDCHDLTRGAQFLVVAQSSDRVVYSEVGRVVEARSVHVLDPADEGGATQGLTCTTSLSAATQVSVTVSSTQAGDEPTAFDTSVQTTTQADGTFGLSVDLTDVYPGTSFTVTATDGDGNTVYDADGHVRDPAADIDLRDLLAELPVLPRLLWLGRQQPALDPLSPESPAAVLQARLAEESTDWDAIGDEISLLSQWKASVDARTGNTGAAPRPALDVSDDDLAVLGALEQLETLDLGTLAETVARALTPLTAAGVVDAIDQTGGEDRVDDARFWPTADPHRLAAVRTALAQLLRNPAGQTMDTELLQFAPEFVAAVEASGSDPARRAFAYLESLFTNVDWVATEFDAALDDPVAFLDRLRTFVAYPESLTDADWSALDGDFVALAGYYRKLRTLPGFDRAVDRTKAFADVLDRQRVEEEMEPRAHETATHGVAQVLDVLEEFPGARSEAEFTHLFELLEEPLDELDDIDHVEPTKKAFESMLGTIERFHEKTDGEEPWQRFERFDERFEDANPDLGVDGKESDEATPSTEFVAVLCGLRQVSSIAEERMREPDSEPVFRAAAARTDFESWWTRTTSSLTSEVQTAVQPLAAVARSTRLDETFRRCLLETLRIPLLRASYFGVYASTPQSATGGKPDDERTLVAQAQGVRERLHQRLDDASAQTAAVQRLVQGAGDYATAASVLAGETSTRPDSAAVTEAVERELDRLSALFGESFVVLPPLSPPNQAELSKTFATAHVDELLADAAPMETETWLQRAARVRERPAALQQTLSYAEMVSGRLLRDGLTVGQLPYRETDDWVGIDGLDETPERGQVSMVTTFPTVFHEEHPVAPSPGDPDGQPGAQLAGFLVDDWRESVPATEEKTGVAVNYDDPSTEPPQSILLAVPPEDGNAPWSTDALLRTILESIDLAKLRGVDLNVIGKPRSDPRQRVLGHLLPALAFPHNTRDVPDTPTVDFDLDSALANQFGGTANGGDGE